MLYPKIEPPYKRHIDGPDRNKIDVGNWYRPEFEVLKDLDWSWTEKVDGTNVRVIWDGYRVSFGGRGNDAQMPLKLVQALRETLPEELMEQQFHGTAATLYGEGHGAGIQGGGNYRKDQGFVLFDVLVEGWWLQRESLQEVACGLQIPLVPVVSVGSVATALDLVAAGLKSQWGDFQAEGLVGKPPLGIMSRGGDRLLMKIKSKDFGPPKTR